MDVGDVTCDGVGDLLVGADGSDVGGADAGTAYVLRGSPGGTPACPP